MGDVLILETHMLKYTVSVFVRRERCFDVTRTVSMCSEDDVNSAHQSSLCNLDSRNLHLLKGMVDSTG